MSASGRTQALGSAAAGEAGGDGAAAGPDAAGRLLGRLTVLPPLLAMAWLLAGLPLLLAGQFRLAFMLAISVPLAVVLVLAGLRWTPGVSHSAFRPASGKQRTPWWAVAGVVAVAVVFGLDQLIYHTQFLVIIRDPASYVQFAYWISHHGSLPVPQDAAAFGGTHHGALRFGSFAFYQDGGSVVPQFMAGMPMVIAAAFWAGGTGAALAVAPVLGAGAVLVFGGLAARLIGPRWAPAGALVLALTLPEQLTSRSDYSEPLAQVLFLGGICLVIDALNSGGVAARIVAALGGLALGLTLLVRIDGASDVLPLVPFCGLLLLGRRVQALPLACGVAVGALLGGVDAYVLSRPYADSLRPSLIPLGIAAGFLLIVTAVAVAALWRRGVPRLRWRPLVTAVCALPVLAAVAFTVRPYVQTTRMPPDANYEGVMAAFQRANHLPVDPTRLYYELSMDWVFWYVGVPAVVLATLGAALLARRCLTGTAPIWILPLVTFGWTIVTTLYEPSITPDQPWASRRLVPTVLPGIILLAVWAVSWLAGRLRRMNRPRPRTLGAVVACCLAALLIPAVVTTFGLRLHHGGPAGVRLAADGTAFDRPYAGEAAAISQLCASIPAHSAVVIVDGPTADRFTQIIRGMCGVPTARMLSPTAARVQQVVAAIAAGGRTPVLAGGGPLRVAEFGGAPARHVMHLRTRIDGSTLTTPPESTAPFGWDIWISEPSP